MYCRGFILIAGLLAGCAGSTSREATYVGWDCVSPGGSREWTCEQKPMRHGRSVAVAAENEAEPDRSPASEPGESPAANYEPLAAAAGDWRQSLPAMDQGVRSSTGADGAAPRRKPRPANRRPAPEPQPAFPESSSGSVAKQTSTRPDVAERAFEDPSFTIQLGAFSNAEARQRYVSESGLAEEALQFYRRRSLGRDWWVLSLGDYDTRARARDAERQLRARYPGLETWVTTKPSATAVSIDEAAGQQPGGG